MAITESTPFHAGYARVFQAAVDAISRMPGLRLTSASVDDGRIRARSTSPFRMTRIVTVAVTAAGSDLTYVRATSNERFIVIDGGFNRQQANEVLRSMAQDIERSP